MEERFLEDSVRSRLILAGLKELLEHSSNDFSLRRVALAAQVSCAAPYRHFKDKDDLIRAIISHIREDWLLLAGEIGNIFEIGTAAHLTELVVAGIRFWIAGGNFPSFLSLGEISSFDLPLVESAREYARVNALTDSDRECLTYSLLCALYGAVSLVASGAADIDSAISRARARTAELLKQ